MRAESICTTLHLSYSLRVRHLIPIRSIAEVQKIDLAQERLVAPRVHTGTELNLRKQPVIVKYFT